MADHTVSKVKTVTLVASTVVSVEFVGRPSFVEVAHHGSAPNVVYVSVGSAVAAPTVAGDDCEVVLAGERLRLGVPHQAVCVVSLISAGTPTVSVVGVL